MSRILAQFPDQQAAASAAGRLRALVRDVDVAVMAPRDSRDAAAERQRAEANQMEAVGPIGLSLAPGVGRSWLYGALWWGFLGAVAGAAVGAVAFALTHGRTVLLVAMIVAGAAAGSVAGLVDAGGMRATQEQERTEALETRRVVLSVSAREEASFDEARRVLEEMHPDSVDIVV